jgi:type III secretion protein J
MKIILFTRYLILMGLVVLAGCKQQLYTSLSERDANEMIAVLAARNLQAEKVATDKGDFRIELDRSDFSAAIEALRDNGLPRPKFSSIGEVFKKEGLVTTANAERLRFMFAMSEELSKTLSLIDGVVEARVHPVLPGGDPLTDKLTLASASVFIKHTSDANLTLLAPAIKDLVCASIEGLTYDKVSLTFVPASKMATQRVQTQMQASSSTSVSYFPTMAVGLAVGLFVVGIGLFWSRRYMSAEPANKHAAEPSKTALHTTRNLISNFASYWKKLTDTKIFQHQQHKSKKRKNQTEGRAPHDLSSSVELRNKENTAELADEPK